MIGAAKVRVVDAPQGGAEQLPCPLKKRMNCLGYMVRDNGHRRVPEPPDRMTGTIRSVDINCPNPFYLLAIPNARAPHEIATPLLKRILLADQA